MRSVSGTVGVGRCVVEEVVNTLVTFTCNPVGDCHDHENYGWVGRACWKAVELRDVIGYSYRKRQGYRDLMEGGRR